MLISPPLPARGGGAVQDIFVWLKPHPVLLPADLQQRAVEFAGLLAHPDVARRNVTAMPKWEKRRSLLLRRMAEKEVTFC